MPRLTRRTCRTALAAAAAFLAASSLLGPAPGATASDRDFDGVADADDNCLWAPNADQRDADGDGLGTACDADLDGDGVVGHSDLAIVVDAFGTSDAIADLNGDGVVGGPDFTRLRLAAGRPVGPGRLDESVPRFWCQSSAACTVPVVPGIALETDAAAIEERADGTLSIDGEVGVPTPAGDVVLPEAELVVTPGEGLSGTSLPPFYLTTELRTSPLAGLPIRVDVRSGLGAELDLEIPLHDDAYYLLFEAGGIPESWIGDVRITSLGAAWRHVLDPTDPFVYTAGDAVIPVSLGGLDFVESGVGFGRSLQGRIPFPIDAPQAVLDELPTIEGDTVSYLAGSLFPYPVSYEGHAVSDVDPDGDGSPVFGDDPAFGDDHVTGIRGFVSLELGLQIPGFSLELTRVPGTVITSHRRARGRRPLKDVWVVGQRSDFEEMRSIDRGLIEVPEGSHGFVAHFGDGPAGDFLLMASESPIVVDTVEMGAAHDVDLELTTMSQSTLRLDSTALTLTSTSETTSFHPDVRFTAAQESTLRWRWDEETGFEYRVESESELGGVALRRYEVLLTDDVFEHRGRYETANRAYELAGRYGPEGAWLEGTVEVSLPYRYPVVEAVVDVAGRLAAQQQVIAVLDGEYDVELSALRAHQQGHASSQATLSSARSALDTAEGLLASARRALRDHDGVSCGTCRWWDAVCWTEVGICEAWKAGARPALARAVELADAGVDTAQAAVTRARAAVSNFELLVANAARAVELALDAADDARAALVLLREERAALPLSDGTVDAVVSLRLARTGLTGSVSGSFEDAPFGDGRVENDDTGSRACFVVPQTGEELCTPL